jgi:hypothetical protein
MGKAQAGKDLIAEIIKEIIESGYKNHYFDTINMAFADSLKNLCKRNHGYQNKIENRDTLIEIGDDMRSIDMDVFVKPVRHFLEIYHKMGYKVFIITDMRYPNEYYSLISELDSIPFVIRIQSIYEHKNLTAFARSHPTENIEFLPDYNIILKPINKETLSEVKKDIEEVLFDILDRYLIEVI